MKLSKRNNHKTIKHSKSYFAFIILFSLLISCGGDDSCTRSNWLGTFEGYHVCSGDSVSATLIITAFEDEGIEVTQEFNGVFTNTYIPFYPDGCKISVTTDNFDTEVVRANLEGDVLIFSDLFYAKGDLDNCIITAKRQ